MSRVTLLLVLVLAACESAPPRGELRLELYNVQDVEVSAQKVMEAVPAPWDEVQGWTVVFQNGLLVVRADAEAHRGVAAYLKARRAK